MRTFVTTLQVLSWLLLLASSGVVCAASLAWINSQVQYVFALLVLSVTCKALERGAANNLADERTNHMAEHLKQFILGEIPPASYRQGP